MKVNQNRVFAIATAIAAAVVVSGASVLVMSQPAAATAQFAKETGKSCGDCHTNAKGGGPLTPLGEKFKANGNKMPP
jgi:mono/diheme cytochrome c family protein